jgi:CubicO group peptidase (beta-lactamase class C family)
VLGRVIEKASGKPYGTYIRDSVCKPLEIKDIKLARNLAKDRDPREVSYPEPDFEPEYLDSDGGLVGTAPALCTFLEHYWLSGTPRQIGSSGESTLDGSIPCLTSIIRQRRDGYNFAVLCNNRRYADFAPNAQLIIKDDQRLQKLVDDAIDKMVKAKGE